MPKGARIVVAVGPEAGWQDPFELDLLAQHGFQVPYGGLKGGPFFMSEVPL